MKIILYALNIIWKCWKYETVNLSINHFSWANIEIKQKRKRGLYLPPPLYIQSSPTSHALPIDSFPLIDLRSRRPVPMWRFTAQKAPRSTIDTSIRRVDRQMFSRPPFFSATSFCFSETSLLRKIDVFVPVRKLLYWAFQQSRCICWFEQCLICHLLILRSLRLFYWFIRFFCFNGRWLWFAKFA